MVGRHNFKPTKYYVEIVKGFRDYFNIYQSIYSSIFGGIEQTNIKAVIILFIQFFIIIINHQQRNELFVVYLFHCLNISYTYTHII